MSNKVFFEDTTPDILVRNKSFYIKNNFWTDEQYNKISSVSPMVEISGTGNTNIFTFIVYLLLIMSVVTSGMALQI